ncbi:hypothetical protein BISA_0658 [Bifidobacterium saguini DSM 23967]|uniref:Uncharacterized protein n=2 Tax=Bifidobacterium saguini TaxID=762210 RepID=A0A087D9R1_9BIFI|nr:hypothetical protein [Bifidobacterium saguini]KFI92261.1 hypothetical protein BISA_0658 [Bifidobacterium saguini DSM 23967]QTB90971.1 hypothetical protein BSD967_00515 [Bifidobacterium saguini]
MREGSRFWRIVGMIVAVIAAVTLTFGVAFAIGRATKDPTTDQTYLALAAQTKKVKGETAENRKKTKDLTEQRDDLRAKVVEQQKKLDEDKKLYQQYAADVQAGQPGLIVESISPDIDPWYTELGGGFDLYYYPKITVRNNTGHVMYGAYVDYQIIGKDGTILDGDGHAYASNIVVYPGKTVVVDDMLKDAGFPGATIRPTKYEATIASPKYPNSTEGIDGQYTDDVKTAVIP